MKNNITTIVLVVFFSLCIAAYAEDKIEFQVVANGVNAGLSSCSNNHVLENDIAFNAFCDSIDLDPSILSYRPNFDSVQLIGIVYPQSSIQASHEIRNIYTNGDTVWVEITYAIPTFSDGVIPQPGYKYQIVAMPRQPNPIGFKLIQLTTVASSHAVNHANLAKVNIKPNQEYDLLGRQIIYTGPRNSFTLRIIRKENKQAKAIVLFPDSK